MKPKFNHDEAEIKETAAKAISERGFPDPIVFFEIELSKAIYRASCARRIYGYGDRFDNASKAAERISLILIEIKRQREALDLYQKTYNENITPFLL